VRRRRAEPLLKTQYRLARDLTALLALTPRRLKKYAEAEEKYRRAKDNLATNTTAAGVGATKGRVLSERPAYDARSRLSGKELRKSCMLNLSLCLLKLGQPDAAEAEATEVLQLDKRSLKGYYRRCVAVCM